MEVRRAHESRRASANATNATNATSDLMIGAEVGNGELGARWRPMPRWLGSEVSIAVAVVVFSSGYVRPPGLACSSRPRGQRQTSTAPARTGKLTAMGARHRGGVQRRRVGGCAALWAGWALGAPLGCSGDDAPSAEPTPAPSGGADAPREAPPIYDPEHVVEVSIELSPDDWQLLRGEGRTLFDVFLGTNPELEYTELPATATVDGVRYENVSVRKKGFLGSLSQLRPSLKLDFGDAAGGLRRLTLNNNRQDPTRARQCLAYGLFERVGLPSPACNLAHVSVNGEDLGTYTNVEPIKKPFVARHFSSDEGNLYEGQIVDFVPEDVERFQLKTNELENDRSDLERLVGALDAPDDELVPRLGEALDLDQFRDLWAVETLAGHWDGYDGNRNNFYVYSDPDSQRLHFMPWGTDGAFAETNPGDAANPTQTVFANGRIANRLYQLPGERERFRARLGELVDELWDESLLVSRLEQLTAQAPDAWPPATAALRRYLQAHGAAVRVELDEPAWEWREASAEASPCNGMIGDVSVELATEYGDLAALNPAAGGFDVALSLDGAPLEPASWFGRAGVDPTSTEPGVVIRALTLAADGTGVLLQLTVPPSELAPGVRPLYALESFGVVVMLGGGAARFVGFVGDGTLELDAASTEDGAPVIGRLNARLLQLACARP